MHTRQKILVTGANGQLGRSFRDLEGNFPKYEFIFLSKEDLPIHQFEMLRHYFNVYQPQWLINCAAYTAVDRAETEKDLAMLVNGEAVGVMAAVAKENHCGFIHISTDYVFDGNSSSPYKVDHPVSPQNEYGRTKLEGERQALLFNPGSIIIRSSWIYSEHGHNFVKTMMRLMKEKESLNVVSDQMGSPTYARDLAEAIMKMITSGITAPRPAIYHFSNSGIISWYDFAVAIKELTGSACNIGPISTAQYPTPAKRPAYSAMDTKKITEDFGVEMIDWKESLKVCLGRMGK
jgi:dTDP-4-dehydrorhamnose reductase